MSTAHRSIPACAIVSVLVAARFSCSATSFAMALAILRGANNKSLRCGLRSAGIWMCAA